MKGIKALLSSKSIEWTTPQDFFDKLNEEFHFTLDPCAQHDTAKCSKYYTREDDGLAQDWGGEQFSVTHHMAESLASGCASAEWRVGSPIQRW